MSANEHKATRKKHNLMTVYRRKVSNIEHYESSNTIKNYLVPTSIFIKYTISHRAYRLAYLDRANVRSKAFSSACLYWTRLDPGLLPTTTSPLSPTRARARAGARTAGGGQGRTQHGSAPTTQYLIKFTKCFNLVAESHATCKFSKKS